MVSDQVYHHDVICKLDDGVGAIHQDTFMGKEDVTKWLNIHPCGIPVLRVSPVSEGGADANVTNFGNQIGGHDCAKCVTKIN